MKAAEIRELSPEERTLKLRELKEELFELTFKKTTGQVDNSSKIRNIKRDIARIHTIMRQLQA